MLEDCHFFNAGKGSVFTNAGTHEMDAAIMDGETEACGACAGVSHVKCGPAPHSAPPIRDSNTRIRAHPHPCARIPQAHARALTRTNTTARTNSLAQTQPHTAEQPSCARRSARLSPVAGRGPVPGGPGVSAGRRRATSSYGNKASGEGTGKRGEGGGLQAWRRAGS
jgi:hypothetical protein